MSRVFKEKEKPPASATATTATTKASSGPVPEVKPKIEPDQGVMLVEATPVKAQKRARLLPTRAPSQLSFAGSLDEAEEEEEDWSIASSPDVLLQRIGQGELGGDDDEGQVLAGNTPVKGSKRKKKASR